MSNFEFETGEIVVINGVNHEVVAVIWEKEEIFTINLETGKRNNKILKDFIIDKITETKQAA